MLIFLWTFISPHDIILTDISVDDILSNDINSVSEVILISENNNHTALSESTYYILLSLITPQHGYGIMQFVKKISNDRLNLTPGTLYGAIKALLDKGLIELHHTDKVKRKICQLFWSYFATR